MIWLLSYDNAVLGNFGWALFLLCPLKFTIGQNQRSGDSCATNWIPQLVKSWICILRIVGSSLTVGGVFFWYEPLASFSLQMASMASKHRSKNDGGANQWIIRVKITPRLLKIQLSLLVKISRISVGDM